jgi:hypothetical protein
MSLVGSMGSRGDFTTDHKNIDNISPALIFFDERCGEYNTNNNSLFVEAYNIGNIQLQQAKLWFLNNIQEQNETMMFHEWALSNEHVRIVTETIPNEIVQRLFNNTNKTLSDNWSGIIYDYSPKGRADDIIYSNHRTIWEKITRGTAIIQFKDNRTNEIISRWLIRANRKFTGHEDEDSHDSKLYCIPYNNNEKPIGAVVTLKENGSVLHLSARNIEINNKTIQIIGCYKHSSIFVFVNSYRRKLLAMIDLA